MRIPLACNLASRDGQVDQDAKVKNAICEIAGQESSVRKRPGMSDYGLVKTGTAQLLTEWNGGVRAVIGDYYCGGPTLSAPYTNNTTFNSSDKSANITLSGGNLTVVSTDLTQGGVRSSGSQSTGRWYFETTLNAVGACIVGICTAAQGLTSYYGAASYVYSSTGSLIREGVTVGTVATATSGDVIGFFADFDARLIYVFKNNSFIGGMSISGAYTYYAFVSTSGALMDATCKFTSFTYTPSIAQTALAVSGTNLPFWAAATGGTAGTSYLAIANRDYMWYVSVLGVPTKVSDTDYPGNMTPARQTVPGIVYLDTYFFVMDTAGRIYNSASNDPTSWSALGFITAQNENGAGVAIGKTKNYVVAFKEYSTEPFYDAANPVGSPLSPVESGFFRIGCASGASVVQWDDSLIWVSQSRSAGRAVHRMQGIENQKISTPDIDRILNADDLATVHAYCMRLEGHDLYVLTLVTSNITLVYDFTSQLWYEWSTLDGSTETYLKQVKYTNFAGADLLLHESDGHLYQVDPDLHLDDALTINTFIRTARLDGGDIGKKKISRARLIGDYVNDTVSIRWSDDDSQTFSDYYDLTMTLQEPEIRRSKAFRRRSYEVRHTGNNPLRLTALELEVSK